MEHFAAATPDASMLAPGSIPIEGAPVAYADPVAAQPPVAAQTQPGFNQTHWVNYANDMRRRNEALEADLHDYRQFQKVLSDPSAERRFKNAWEAANNPSYAPPPASSVPPPSASPPQAVQPVPTAPVASESQLATPQAVAIPELQNVMRSLQGLEEFAAQQRQRMERDEIERHGRELDRKMSHMKQTIPGFDDDEVHRLMTYAMNRKNIKSLEDIDHAYQELLFLRGHQAAPQVQNAAYQNAPPSSQQQPVWVTQAQQNQPFPAMTPPQMAQQLPQGGPQLAYGQQYVPQQQVYPMQQAPVQRIIPPPSKASAPSSRPMPMAPSSGGRMSMNQRAQGAMQELYSLTGRQN